MSAYNYAYDAAGNQVTVLDSDGTTSYAYDELNRLESVTEPSGKVSTYTFDASGNRTGESVTESGSTVTTDYTYNAQNQLTGTAETSSTTVDSTYYYYDNNGNEISQRSETLADSETGDTPSLELVSGGNGYTLYEYNEFDQLVSAETGGSTASYTYNGDGLRASKTVTADGTTETTKYLYEYDDVVLELDENGDQTAYNVYGGNTLISGAAGGETLYYLYNGHGDVIQLTDASGSTVMTYKYDAFGNVTSSTGTRAAPYRYSGYRFDEETGLYYLNARYYDPVIARFTSADTYYGQQSDPLSLNLYTYCHNEPIMYWDPTGHNGALAQDYSWLENFAVELETALAGIGTTLAAFGTEACTAVGTFAIAAAPYVAVAAVVGVLGYGGYALYELNHWDNSYDGPVEPMFEIGDLTMPDFNLDLSGLNNLDLSGFGDLSIPDLSGLGNISIPDLSGIGSKSIPDLSFENLDLPIYDSNPWVIPNHETLPLPEEKGQVVIPEPMPTTEKDTGVIADPAPEIKRPQVMPFPVPEIKLPNITVFPLPTIPSTIFSSTNLPNQGVVKGNVPGAPPIDAGKQGKHVPGHNNNNPSKSQWQAGNDGVDLTQKGWLNGETLPDGTRVWDTGSVIGNNGETGVRVHRSQKTGDIHGYPVNPGQYLK